MTLTQNHINDLYQFTKQHYVEWYDLQSELVDHLANDIEHIWENEPQLSFEEAKNKSFKKFGVLGFENVVKQRRKALGKHYFKLFWKEFKQFFTIPKIALTISLFFAVLFLIRLVHYNMYVIITMIALVIIVPFAHMIKSRKEVKWKEKVFGKKFMFEDYISNLGSVGGLISIPFQIMGHIIILNKYVWDFNMEMIFTSTMVLCGVAFYILVFEIPPKVRGILTKENPEYQIN